MFPTIVYRCPGAHHRKGGTFSFMGVSSESELSTALNEGWFKTLPEAIEETEYKVVSDNSQPTRSEMEQQATKLGLKFDGRTTDKVLLERIAAALE